MVPWREAAWRTAEGRSQVKSSLRSLKLKKILPAGLDFRRFSVEYVSKEDLHYNGWYCICQQLHTTPNLHILCWKYLIVLQTHEENLTNLINSAHWLVFTLERLAGAGEISFLQSRSDCVVVIPMCSRLNHFSASCRCLMCWFILSHQPRHYTSLHFQTCLFSFISPLYLNIHHIFCV